MPAAAAAASAADNPGADVLNGIAYTQRTGAEVSVLRLAPPPLPARLSPRRPSQASAPLSTSPWGGRLWLTGKKWDTMFEIEVTATEAVRRRR